jgi:glycerophosphoryl diester phosphodiesterase
MNEPMRRHWPLAIGWASLRLAAVVTLGGIGIWRSSGDAASRPAVSSSPAGCAVTLLEAVHVAEIHTGGVASSASLDRSSVAAAEGACYRIEIAQGDSPMVVRIDAAHGRLMSISRPGDGGDGELAYRWPGVRVVAHRGGAELGPPENTLPAIERAIEVGADLIEIDIRETADGHLLLMHDATVDRTTDGQGRVRDLTLEEIRRLRVGPADGTSPGKTAVVPVRVPTLAEALEVMRGRIDADLDFKQGDLGRLLEVVRQAGMERHSTFCGPWARCEEIARLEPAIRIRPTAEYPQQVPGLIRELRPALVNLDWHAVTEDSIRWAHLGGCHAFVNCLGSADTELYARLAIRMGADYIQSDRPDRVIRILQETGHRKGRLPLGDPLGTPLRDPKLGYPLR